jgi:hypothetical protein
MHSLAKPSRNTAMNTPHADNELTTRSISLATPYGEVVASEQVPACEFHAALRRIYARAVQCANGVVVLDGVMQSRNTFLEFVRQFNESADRTARLQRA